MKRVAASVSPAVECGRPASRRAWAKVGLASLWRRALIPPGKMPGSTAGRRPATTFLSVFQL
jgi:hypothetical protein